MDVFLQPLLLALCALGGATTALAVAARMIPVVSDQKRFAAAFAWIGIGLFHLYVFPWGDPSRHSGFSEAISAFGVGAGLTGPVQLWRLRHVITGIRIGMPLLRLQLLLILLPVGLLAAIGCIGLYRDQAAVEAETRRRAQAITDDLARKLSTHLPLVLTRDPLSRGLWQDGNQEVMGSVFWPNEEGGWKWGDSPDPGAELPEHLRRELRENPHYLVPVKLRWNSSGALIRPPSYPPAPIPHDWLAGQPPAAQDAWKGLQEAKPGSEFDAAAEALHRLAPVPEARLQAEWIHLLRDTSAIDELYQFGRRAVNERVLTETGLPLGAVAFAEAVRRLPNRPLSSNSFILARELLLTQPSILSPWVLAQTLRAPPEGNGSLVEGLSRRWNVEEHSRIVGRSIAEQVALPVTVLQTRWIRVEGLEWWVELKPGTIWVQNSPTNWISRTNDTTEARCLSRLALRELVFAALSDIVPSAGTTENLRDTPGWLPAGTRLAVFLDGHGVTLPSSSWTAVDDDPSSVLAKSSGTFDPQGIFAPTGNPKNSSQTVPFDVWPSQPRFEVRLLLTFPRALFAAQRRQQFWFGGMILLTAGVAGFGAWQTQKAFLRQLAINEQKSNFVSAVSHELRAPLASLRLLAEGLADGRVAEEPKRREYARFIVQETRRLGTLVENVLGLARVDAGRHRYEFGPIDLTRLVRDTSRQLELLAVDRGVALEYQGPDPETHPVELVADAAALQQALTNLIDNAIKHAPVGTPVTVTLMPPESGSVVLRVQDQGPGIPLEDHERIFERFYRRGSELRRETQGVGLGLTLVREIATAHGGTIHVESEPGKGATFILSLPVDRTAE
jgi:signal transduction histidine kinase